MNKSFFSPLAMLFLLVVLFTLNSCAKDSDLFYDSIGDDISDNIDNDKDVDDGSGDGDDNDQDNPTDPGNGEGGDTDGDLPTDDTISTDLKAFPTAEGFGKKVTGGRGGKVYTVTNLNKSGPGSFVEALEASGPRIIVFAVGGTIELDYEDQVYVRNGDLTIAGQTAPANSGGITIKGSIRFNYTDNIILRNIRFRLGDNGWKDSSGNIVGSKPSGIAYDGLELLNVSNMIIDHCSVSWSIDENFSVVDSENITIQNCIISEALARSVHYESSSHSMGVLINRSQNVTFYNNYVAHNSERNIRAARSTFELINNVFYDFRGAGGFSSGQSWTAIGNHWKKGVTEIGSANITSYINDSGQGHSGSIYYSDNSNDFNVPFLAPNWESYVVGSPPVDSGINPKSVNAAIDYVLANAGARYPYFDTMDQRVIQDYYSTSGKIVDSPEMSGGYPSLNTGTAKKDSDGDGMPDDWETAMGLDPQVPDDNGDIDNDGYTNIEEYINLIDSAI
ncbi:pectate lyase family protein [Flagellimonas sp.]|uniref:pectate lyase family protein n=1 Tax=Flagellimonas sp. TaxID=2058762 RepID=UPI003AB56FF3